MKQITTPNVANAIVKLVAVDALPSLLGNLVMGNLVRRNFEPTPAQSGDTVNVPIPPVLTANNPSNGEFVVTQGDKLIVLNSHIGTSFLIPDVTKILAVPDLLKLYMEPAVIAIAEKIESDLLNLYAEFTSNAIIGTGGTALTEASVDSAETALFNAKVPAASQKYLVVDGTTYGQLRQNPRFSEFRTAGEAGVRAMIDGPVGKLKDFFVFRSQFVPKTGSGPVTTNNIAFAKDAIGLAIRRLPQPLPGTGLFAEYAEIGNFGVRVLMSYQPNTLAQLFTIEVLYGVSVLRENYGVQIKS